MNNNSSNDGVSFLGLLTIVFIALKVTGLLDWSWYQVLSPLWVPIILLAASFLILFLFFLFSDILNSIIDRFNR